MDDLDALIARPMSLEQIAVARKVLGRLKEIHAEGRDPTMTDVVWEDLSAAITTDESWLATVDALTARAETAEARVRELESNQIPPGCVAVCRMHYDTVICGMDCSPECCNSPNCPLRSVSPSP